jgi:hypothetical protein
MGGMQRAENGSNQVARTSKMPGSPSRLLAPDYGDYAEEALRSSQRFVDQQRTIEALTHERDDWRNRALLAEGEGERLAKRESDLMAQLDRKTTEHLAERGEIEKAIAVMNAQFTTASTILLEGMTTIRELAGAKDNKINVPSLEAVLDSAPADPAPSTKELSEQQ